MDMEELDLLELWHIVVKRRRMIILLFVLAVAAAVFLNIVTEPVYQARATLMLKSGKTDALASLDPLGALTGSSSANIMIQNYIYMLKSRSILTKALETLGWETVTDADIRAVTNGLTVQQISGTEIIEIRFDSTDRVFATDLVNTLSQVFIASTRDENRSDLKTAREYLAEQIEIAQDHLTNAEEKLRRFRENERIMQPMQDSSLLLQQYTEWDKMAAQAQLAKMETELRLRELQDKLAAQDEIIISSTTIQDNPMVRSYQQRLAELEVSLSGALERYTERHPEVLSLQAEINEIKTKLANEVERVIATETQTINPIRNELYSQLINAQVELVALSAREQAIAKVLKELDQQYTNVPEKELELARLIREVQMYEDIYLMLMTRNEEIRINEQMHSGNLQVVDHAIIPENPIKPRVMLNLAIGGVLGLFMGLGLAFLLEFMDNTVKNKDDVEKYLALPVIGQIPQFDRNNMQSPHSRANS